MKNANSEKLECYEKIATQTTDATYPEKEEKNKKIFGKEEEEKQLSKTTTSIEYGANLLLNLANNSTTKEPESPISLSTIASTVKSGQAKLLEPLLKKYKGNHEDIYHQDIYILLIVSIIKNNNDSINNECTKIILAHLKNNPCNKLDFLCDFANKLAKKEETKKLFETKKHEEQLSKTPTNMEDEENLLLSFADNSTTKATEPTTFLSTIASSVKLGAIKIVGFLTNILNKIIKNNATKYGEPYNDQNKLLINKLIEIWASTPNPETKNVLKIKELINDLEQNFANEQKKTYLIQKSENLITLNPEEKKIEINNIKILTSILYPHNECDYSLIVALAMGIKSHNIEKSIINPIYLNEFRSFDTENKSIFKALELAAKENNQELLASLIIKLRPERLKSDNGKKYKASIKTAIEIATKNKNGEILKILLPETKTKYKSGRNTPLMIAVTEGNTEQVNILIQVSKCNDQNSLGYTALMLATTSCNREIVKLLVQSSNCDIKNHRGVTALILALELINIDPEIVKVLADHTNLNLTYYDKGLTATSVAAQKNCEKSIKYLIDKEEDNDNKIKYIREAINNKIKNIYQLYVLPKLISIFNIESFFDKKELENIIEILQNNKNNFILTNTDTIIARLTKSLNNDEELSAEDNRQKKTAYEITEDSNADDENHNIKRIKR